MWCVFCSITHQKCLNTYFLSSFLIPGTRLGSKPTMASGTGMVSALITAWAPASLFTVRQHSPMEWSACCCLFPFPRETYEHWEHARQRKWILWHVLTTIAGCCLALGVEKNAVSVIRPTQVDSTRDAHHSSGGESVQILEAYLL